MSTQEQRDEWRKLRFDGMTSAIGEYTPPEFWDLLDEIDDFEKERNDLKKECKTLHELLDQQS